MGEPHIKDNWIVHYWTHRLMPVIPFLLLCVQGFSQAADTAFFSSFSGEGNCFPSEVSSRGSTGCKDGKYLMNHLDTLGKSWRQSVLVQFDPLRDFSIENMISVHDARSGSSAGLVFGYKDVEHGNYFVVDAAGNFMIVQMNGSSVNFIRELSYTAALKEEGQPNLLRVEMKGGTCSFFINENKVAESKEIKMFDTRIGFYTENKIRLEADYLLVKQQKASIHLFPLWEGFGKKEQMGPEINTIYGEKHPIISPDGQFLYVNREDNPYNTDGPKEDVWFSELKNGKWTKMKNLGYPINNCDFNYIAGISADNSLLLLGNVYNADLKSMREGFSVSYKNGKSWGIPQEVKIDDYYNRNKYNGACISADKKTIIMTIERDDTYGEKDLYVCFMKADSTWTAPKNMGKVVNSWGAEFGPYLAPDGKTLYYSSFGLPGYGEADLFVTTRLDDSWTNWSEPMNLGPKINTRYWDGYFSVSAAGDYAYISSTEHGRGDLDAYRIKMPSNAYLVNISSFDKKSLKPLAADFVVKQCKSNDTLLIKRAAPAAELKLPEGNEFELIVSCSGYYAVRETIETGTMRKGVERMHKTLLTPVEKGTTIVLKNVEFNPNESVLLNSSYVELNVLAKTMKTNPTMRIEIAGHTSKTSEGEAFNFVLSKNRALAVKEYLVKAGIAPERIVHQGYGYQKPLYQETDEFHQAQNRRVEFTVLTK